MNSTPDAPELPPLPARWSIERIYAGPAQGYLVSGPDGSASVWPTDRNPKLILFKLAEALAARQPEPVAHVAIPKSADEAELMLKLGHLWLTQNAPERLAQPPADLEAKILRIIEHTKFNPNRADDAVILRGRLLQIRAVANAMLSSAPTGEAK